MSPPPGQGGGDALMSTLLMFVLIIGIFYFMIIRPQQKRAKDREKMIESVKKGDKIITSGGIHGTIAGADEKTFLVQVADNVKVKFDRSAVTTIIKEGEVAAKEAK